MNEIELIKSHDNEYDFFLKEWDLVDDLLKSNVKFRDKYLERKPLEYREYFNQRKKVAFKPPDYQEQLSVAMNKIGINLSKLININDINPRIISEALPQNKINQISFQIFRDILHYGGGGGAILFDMDKQEPYFTRISPKNVIYSSEYMMKIISSQRELKGFQEEIIEKITIFTKNNDSGYFYHEYEIRDKKLVAKAQSEQFTNRFGEVLDKMPVAYGYAINTENNNYFRHYPVMQELAEQSLRLFQVETDLSNVLNIALCPILVCKKEQNDPLYDNNGSYDIDLGRAPDALITIGVDESLNFVDTNTLSTSLNSAFQQIKSIKEGMRLLGQEVLFSQSPTATARLFDQSQADTGIGQVLVGLQVCLNQIIGLYAFWLGIEDAGIIRVNTDVSSILMSSFDNDKHQQIRNDFLAGAIDRESYLSELVARGVFKNINTQEDIERIIQNIIQNGDLGE